MPTGAQSAAYPVRPRCKSSSFLIVTVTLFIFASKFCYLVSAQSQNAIQQLLKFKSSLANSEPALSNWNASVLPCPLQSNAQGNWEGVICYNGYVWGLQLENKNLQGQIDVDSLVPLRFVRTISFMNNGFEGSMPDWRKLGALKSLYLSNNKFSGQIAEDAFKGMSSLKKVHLANNGFTGPIPASIKSPKLIELRLENNQFTGTIPPISSEFLKNLNVSNNRLEGPVPAPLAKLDPSSFAGNKALCGEPVGAVCNPPILPPNNERNLHPSSDGDEDNKGLSGAMIAIIVVCILLALFLILLLVFLCRRRHKNSNGSLGDATVAPSYDEPRVVAVVPASLETNVPVAKPEHQQPGKLSFMRDDRQRFDLQDLMRASAEVLGSGTFGASYKAVLVDGEALVVKRFKQMNNVAKEDFHEHMRRLGRLSHPNLLPLVAYLYRKEEKLLVFDYMTNGSLAQHLYGKHSVEHPGLNWAIRLRIIKGVAKGLAYLHRELGSLTVFHGHLKSSNVVLDKDFNSMLMDYSLAPVVNPCQVHQVLVAYKSPEYAQEGRISKKTDVWCLGILILETLSGKYVEQGSGAELARWVSEIVRDANTGDNTLVFDKEMSVGSLLKPEMEKLLQIGIACCREDPDERWDLEEAVRQIEQVQESS